RHSRQAPSLGRNRNLQESAYRRVGRLSLMFITISQFLSHRPSWANVRVLLTHDRNPWIVEAALKHFVIDGEAVTLGVDGHSGFNALHSGRHNEEVQLCAFDVLAMDGDDLRDLPLSMRKANLV